MAIKNRLKEILSEKNISQSKLTEQLDISKSTLSNIINDRQNPTLETAIDIAIYLNLSVEDIFYKMKSQDEAIEDFDKLVEQANQLYKLYENNSFSRQEIISIYRTLISTFLRQYDNIILDYCSENRLEEEIMNPLFEKVVLGVE